MGYVRHDPTHQDMTRLYRGSFVEMKQLYLRWNELVASRWMILDHYQGASKQTKIMPSEKHIDRATVWVYVLRPMPNHHADYPPRQPCDWEVSEAALYEWFELI